MSELTLIKTPGGMLAPADNDTVEAISKMKVGEAMHGEFKKVRNLKFHRKGFALLNFSFDNWDPLELEYKGEKVTKNFDQFRKDVTILAGFYTTSINLKGEVRLSAKSISFKSMKEDEFDKWYNAVVNVVLAKILTKYTRDDLDSVVDQLLGFV